jgi:threonine/homoserine/homoserine lactone efflux protein
VPADPQGCPMSPWVVGLFAAALWWVWSPTILRGYVYRDWAAYQPVKYRIRRAVALVLALCAIYIMVAAAYALPFPGGLR